MKEGRVKENTRRFGRRYGRKEAVDFIATKDKEKVPLDIILSTHAYTYTQR